MTASRALGVQRGIPEDKLLLIDELHSQIESFIVWALEAGYGNELVKPILRGSDFLLQDLWQFSRDEQFHTYYKQFLFRKQWYGRKFRCEETGEEFTMPHNVRERQCYTVGNGFIDVGRLDCYSRTIGKIEEVGNVS